MDQAAVELVQAALALAGAGLVVLMSRRGASPRTLVVASVLAALSAGSYVRFGAFHFPRFLHNWDLFHYYLGTKYFDELGYEDLYRCALQADDESGQQMVDVVEVRELGTLGLTTAAELVRSEPRCREQFGEARWREFTGDVEFFCRITPRRLWRSILVDKGYNGTPPWTLYAGALSSWARTDRPARVTLVCAVDEVLALLALLSLLWAFGPRVFLVATLFFGVNFAARFGHVGGSLLRLDWLASLTLSLAALKKGRHAAAGVLLAHSAAARLFPILFAAGIVARAAFTLGRERRIERGHLRFGIGLAAGLAFFALLGAAGPRGPRAWVEFAESIAVHASAPAGKRIGLKYVILPAGGLDLGEDASSEEVNRALEERWERRRPIAIAVAVVALLLVAIAVRRSDDVQAFALGALLVFFLLSPTRYYWAMLLVPVAAWAASGERRLGEAVAALFLMQALLFLFDRTGPTAAMLSVISSCCLLLIFGTLLWSSAAPDLAAAWARATRRASPGSG
jgi:hypothetical protein